MIAKIIPILRLPRGLNAFDYKIPDSMFAKLKIGQFVKINFRNRNALGIIYKIQKTSKYKQIKVINKVVKPELYLNNQQLLLIPQIAKLLFISWSSVLLTFLPPLSTKKTKVKNLAYTAKSINIKKFKLQKLGSKNIVNYRTNNDRISFYLQLTKNSSQQILIVSPDKKSAQDIYQHMLFKHSQSKVALITSDLNKGQYAQYWQAIYENKIKIIIGTKKSLFFPFKQLRFVVIDQEGDFNHRQWDQSPRYETVDIANLITKTYKANLILVSCFLSISSYYQLQQKKYNYYRLKTESKKNRIEFYKNEEDGWLSDFVINKLTSDKKNKQTLILTNRLNYSNLLQCQDCNYIYICPSCSLPLHYSKTTNQLSCYHCNYHDKNPLLCNDCHGSNLKYSGIGQEKMLEKLKELKPKLTCDKFNATKKNINTNANVIVSSTAILPYIGEFKFSSIIIPILEQFSTPVDIYTQWRIIYLLYYLQSFGLTIFVQSFSDNNISTHFNNPIRFLKTELSNLKIFNYPPFGNLVKIIIKGSTRKTAEENSKKLYNELAKKFATNQLIKPNPAIPFMKNNKYRYNIILRNLQSRDLDFLTKINYPNVVYDINPPKLISS